MRFSKLAVPIFAALVPVGAVDVLNDRDIDATCEVNVLISLVEGNWQVAGPYCALYGRRNVVTRTVTSTSTRLRLSTETTYTTTYIDPGKRMIKGRDDEAALAAVTPSPQLQAEQALQLADREVADTDVVIIQILNNCPGDVVVVACNRANPRAQITRTTTAVRRTRVTSTTTTTVTYTRAGQPPDNGDPPDDDPPDYTFYIYVTTQAKRLMRGRSPDIPERHYLRQGPNYPWLVYTNPDKLDATSFRLSKEPGLKWSLEFYSWENQNPTWDEVWVNSFCEADIDNTGLPNQAYLNFFPPSEAMDRTVYQVVTWKLVTDLEHVVLRSPDPEDYDIWLCTETLGEYSREVVYIGKGEPPQLCEVAQLNYELISG